MTVDMFVRAAACVAVITVTSNAVRAEGGHTAPSHAGGSPEAEAALMAEQRAALAEATRDQGFGPQSPRDLDRLDGRNPRTFELSPPHVAMNLCNIHFHENAEHRGGDFTTFAGMGDGHGYGTGYKYDGQLTPAERAVYRHGVGDVGHGDLRPGDTIEVHFVFTTAKVVPGPTLGACLSEAIQNPQLRVEGQVFVLVNDENALDFRDVAEVVMLDGLYQPNAIPDDTGLPIQYAGSTTGPSYNEVGSPFQVSWSVRPRVAKLSIQSVEAWLASNSFDEDHAHGVRNLVVNPDLLSAMQ